MKHSNEKASSHYVLPLNENQQVLLTWLKESTADISHHPFYLIRTLVTRAEFASDELPLSVKQAYNKLMPEEEFNVLLAFAQWGATQNTT